MTTYAQYIIRVDKTNIDYNKVNNFTKTDSCPIPRIEDCIDKLGNANYITKFDLLKGFWQIPLTARAKKYLRSLLQTDYFNTM